MAEWTFSFQDGDVKTRRVTTDVNRAPETSIAGLTLELVLIPEEVKTVEESLSETAAVNFREVPDGDNLVEDLSDNTRQTVNIQPPNNATDTVDPGDYVCTNWETTWTQGKQHNVVLSLVEP